MTDSRGATANEALALSQWDDWLQGQTDRLLSLDERAKSAGTDKDRSDIAAAFVARKAIAERLQQLATLPIEQHGTVAAQPLVDALGGAVADNLAQAATLLAAIVDAVEARIGRVEQTALAEAANQADIAADLVVCERLANQLGSEVNVVTEIRRAMSRGEELNGLAKRAKELRTRLERGDRERSQAFAQWPEVPGRVEQLADLHQRAVEAAAECRDKIKNAPPLAIPTLDGLDQPKPIDELRAMPWNAARAHMQSLLSQVDRLHAALTEASERFQAPVRERGELRGLLQAFGRKAAATGGVEDPALAPLYAEAESVLWTAPCDIDAGRDLVQRYIAAVNARVTGTQR